MNSASDSLAKLQKHKQTDSAMGLPLGPEMLAFLQETVQRARQTKLAKIAEVWGALGAGDVL